MARTILSTAEALAVYDRAREMQRERRGGHIRQLLVEARREMFGGPTFEDHPDDADAAGQRAVARHRILYPRAGNAALAVLIPAVAIALVVGGLAFAFRGPIAEFSSPQNWHARIAN